MSSVELRSKTELTSIAGTENVYIQEAGSPYTVKRTLLNTIKTWITSTPLSTVLKLSSYAITDSDGYARIEVDTTSGDITITMPLMANNRGRRIEIANIKGGTNKVIINPHATDSSKLSGDGLAAMWLPKIGDFVVFQESANSGYWEVVNERITSQLRLHTSASYGTDNKIARFSTSIEDVGNMFTHNHGSYGAAKGLEITSQRSGLYGMDFWWNSDSGTTYTGISLDSALLTTSVISLAASAPATVLSLASMVAGGNPQTVITKIRLNKNQVLRPHTSGSSPTTASNAGVIVTYLGQ